MSAVAAGPGRPAAAAAAARAWRPSLLPAHPRAPAQSRGSSSTVVRASPEQQTGSGSGGGRRQRWAPDADKPFSWAKCVQQAIEEYDK